MRNQSKSSLYEDLKAGLEEGIRFARGEVTLRVTILPMPPPRFKAAEVTALRKQLRMSRLAFARTLNVSYRTVQAWEQGRRRPSQAALRLLQVLRDRPEAVESILDAAS